MAVRIAISDSDIARSDLLRAVIYPDSDDVASPLGNGPDGVYDRVEHRYNRLGEIKETKDQSETVHTFEFDKLGRQTHDRITTLGSGVDGAVRRVSTSYEVRGLVEKSTSYDNATVGSGSVVNEVVREYNDVGLLTKDAGGGPITNTYLRGMYVDTDMNTNTGYKGSGLWMANGYDVYVEYAGLGDTYKVYDFAGATQEIWAWTNESTFAYSYSENVIEWAIPRSRLGAGDAIVIEFQVYGEGVAVGPDLTGAGRQELDYLLENILYPNAVIPAGYRASVVTMKDGRVLLGTVEPAGGGRVSLRTVTSPEPVLLDEKQIATAEALPRSLMPAGLLWGLEDAQVRDLFAYLMGSRQVPLPE